MKRRFSILVCILLMFFMHICTWMIVSADERKTVLHTITFTDESGNEVETLNEISTLNAVYDVKNVRNGILSINVVPDSGIVTIKKAK